MSLYVFSCTYHNQSDYLIATHMQIPLSSDLVEEDQMTCSSTQTQTLHHCGNRAETVISQAVFTREHEIFRRKC